MNHKDSSTLIFRKGEPPLSEESLQSPTPTSEDNSSIKRFARKSELSEKNFFVLKNRASDFDPERDFEIWFPRLRRGLWD